MGYCMWQIRVKIVWIYDINKIIVMVGIRRGMIILSIVYASYLNIRGDWHFTHNFFKCGRFLRLFLIVQCDLFAEFPRVCHRTCLSQRISGYFPECWPAPATVTATGKSVITALELFIRSGLRETLTHFDKRARARFVWRAAQLTPQLVHDVRAERDQAKHKRNKWGTKKKHQSIYITRARRWRVLWTAVVRKPTAWTKGRTIGTHSRHQRHWC